MSDKKAFVIMQVGAEDSPERRRATEIFENLIEPALSKAGYEAYRSDLDPSPGPITPKMLAELISSDLVVADLTGRNPNVFYEYGIVHSFGLPHLAIADSVMSLPFDTKDERIIPVGIIPAEGITVRQVNEARKALDKTLEVITAPGYVPTTPLRETASIVSLTPDDPVASELGKMRSVIENLEKVMKPTPEVPPALLNALSALREFVESTMKEFDTEPAFKKLVKNKVGSKEHIAWLTSIEQQKFPQGINEQPWGTSWGSSSNEPPF